MINKWITSRVLLIAGMTYFLKYLFIGGFNYNDILAIIFTLGLVANEIIFTAKSKRENKAKKNPLP